MTSKAQRMERALAVEDAYGSKRYRSDTVDVELSLRPAEAESLIGLRITHVTGWEHGLTLDLSDGRSIQIEGSGWEGGLLGVELRDPSTTDKGD